MKRFIALLMVLLLVIPAFSIAEEEKVINILSWVGYVDDDTLADFTARTGIKVIWSPMESNDDMLLKITQSGGAGYDLILASDYALNILQQEALIQKLDLSKFANYANLDEKYLNQPFDPSSEYVIPYTAGCPLIIYDAEKVPFEITGYEDLWDERLEDSIAIMDSARILGGITLKTMGKGFNETDPAVLDEMKEKLMPLYKNIRLFGDMDAYSAVSSGEVSVGFMFTPFVFLSMMDAPDLTVVYPKEGLGFGIDGFVIPAQAANVDGAHQFLDFLMDPQIAAHNAEWQAYMCVNKAANEFLSETFTQSPVFSVPDDMIKNAEYVENIGASETLYQEIYTEFKNQ
ncbi:MAG: spermidine/putrescine ABC transporter substrate-binding protein [Clostridiales bacterium]|nr:spermidine/putrescine ABC transporter substrate-binding protein [Clostridiales bacterium]